MSKLGKVIMFLSSYSPLYILIITLNYSISDLKSSMVKLKHISSVNTTDVVLYILIILIIVCNIVLKIILNESNNYTETIKIKGISDGNDKILDYILGYIVSFMTTDFVNLGDSDSKVLITGILIQILLCYLYCKSNMLYVNPVLNVCFGYEIFIAETNRNNLIILTKDRDKAYFIKEKIAQEGFKNIRLNYFSKDIYILN